MIGCPSSPIYESRATDDEALPTLPRRILILASKMVMTQSCPIGSLRVWEMRRRIKRPSRQPNIPEKARVFVLRRHVTQALAVAEVQHSSEFNETDMLRSIGLPSQMILSIRILLLKPFG